jgi:hypothetical protein
MLASLLIHDMFLRMALIPTGAATPNATLGESHRSDLERKQEPPMSHTLRMSMYAIIENGINL